MNTGNGGLEFAGTQMQNFPLSESKPLTAVSPTGRARSTIRPRFARIGRKNDDADFRRHRAIHDVQQRRFAAR